MNRLLCCPGRIRAIVVGLAVRFGPRFVTAGPPRLSRSAAFISQAARTSRIQRLFCVEPAALSTRPTPSKIIDSAQSMMKQLREHEALELVLAQAQPPVLQCGAATGFDWGDPRCRRKMVSATMLNTAKNSLCQF